MAAQGKGRRFRTLVATNKGNRWVFVYGFPKNERSNVDKDEEEALKKLAANLLSLTAQALGKAIWCKSAAWKSSPETPTTCS